MHVEDYRSGTFGTTKVELPEKFKKNKDFRNAEVDIYIVDGTSYFVVQSTDGGTPYLVDMDGVIPSVVKTAITKYGVLEFREL